jgi:hypothetical protein
VTLCYSTCRVQGPAVAPLIDKACCTMMLSRLDVLDPRWSVACPGSHRYTHRTLVILDEAGCRG